MDIKELTEKMHEFVSEKGWYDSQSSKQQSLRNLAISLNLEASEVLEIFQWTETLKDKESLASELADVSLYLLQLASIADIDLEKAILQKLAQNHTRSRFLAALVQSLAIVYMKNLANWVNFWLKLALM